MGSKHSHPPPPNVPGDLNIQITRHALDLLRQDYNVSLDSQTPLDQILRQLATRRFRQRLGYDYDDDRNRCRPPDSLGGVRPVTKMVDVTNVAGNAMPDYIDAVVLSQEDLPAWMRANAKAGLASRVRGLLSRDTGGYWIYDDYVQVFEAAKEDENSIKCTCTLLYTNGSLTEDGINARMCLLYFMCVYYQVESETSSLRHALQRNAYSSAMQLDSSKVNIKTNAELSAALAAHSTKNFLDRFRFAYKSTPPQYPSDLTAGIITYNDHMCYFQDMDASHLPAYVEYEVFSGLNIVNKRIKDAAINDVLIKFQTAAAGRAVNTWVHEVIDQTYEPTDPFLNPMHTNGLLISFQSWAKTSAGVTISVNYIYYMTMFYEVLPRKVVLIKNLFQELCNNLKIHLNPNPYSSNVEDEETLRCILFDYSKQEFQKAFSFPYQDNSTQPPDAVGRVACYAEIFDFAEYPPSNDLIKRRVDVQFFPRDGLQFPTQYAQQNIYDDIVQKITLYTGASIPKENEKWYTEHYTETFTKSDDRNDTKSHLIKEYSTWVYALGVKSEGDVRIQRVFAYCLEVFCGVNQT